MTDLELIRESVAKHASKILDANDRIWDYAELAFHEHKSAELLCRLLEEEGFTVQRGLAEIPTCFTGTYKKGTGKPVMGFLGEFDALSSLSQQAALPEKSPVTAGAPGHGCGHCALGTGSLAAAFALKDYLDATGEDGTVIYFGCPAEEGAGSKQFMARAGLFDDVDFVYTWHPSTINGVESVQSNAIMGANFRFKGRTSHAAASPHLGRSALDAVELMSVGCNYLREHVIPEARIHYAITNTGGYSPNVVQPEAEVLYLIRAPKNAQVQEIYARVNKIAQGAAMMTETDLTIDFYKACSNLTPITVMEELIYKNLCEAGLPEHTDADREFARQIRESIENKSDTVAALLDKATDPAEKELYRKHLGDPLNDFIVPYHSSELAMAGSTDVCDVSWFCPTAHGNTACYASGTPGHSWQLVAQGKAPVAHAAMLQAGRVMAGTAIDLFESPELLEKAKAEHAARVGDGYVCPIPAGVKPRPMGAKK